MCEPVGFTWECEGRQEKWDGDKVQVLLSSVMCEGPVNPWAAAPQLFISPEQGYGTAWNRKPLLIGLLGHISLGPRGAHKINFLWGFATGVFTPALIMPSTEKDQRDAWRQWSYGSTAQNHLNPTTFVQDAACSAHQSFSWIISARKKQTYSN